MGFDAAGWVDVVVGGQYGSEGKGAVAAALIEKYASYGEQAASVRVGGPNAGHTAYDYEGRKFALRQIPVGVVKNTEGPLVIAAGSELDIEVVAHEIQLLEDAGHPVRDRLFIDAQATVIEDADKQAEAAGSFKDKFGSTAKGIGAARARRLRREAAIAENYADELADLGAQLSDTQRLVSSYARGTGNPIVIEGTQGYALGLHAGAYPFCTAGDVRVCDALAQVGIHPYDNAYIGIEPWVVLRAFPIRVAGNSGPMRNETSWEALSLPEERTTVTQLVRRVGEWDEKLAHDAIAANGSNVNVALTMADQLHPGIAGATTVDQLNSNTAARDWVNEIEAGLPFGARISYVGTGPDTRIWMEA